MKTARTVAANAALIVAACAAAGAAPLPAPPLAPQTQTFTFTGPGDSSVVDVLINGKSLGVYAGRYHATINGAAANIFCTDFSHEIATGDSYAADAQYGMTGLGASGGLTGAYYNGGLVSALTPADYAPDLTRGLGATQRAGEVAWLADNYLGATTLTFAGGQSGATDLKDNLAGVNLAIWDIVQDGATGFSSGQVQLCGQTAGYFSGLGSYYETLASSHGAYTSKTADWLQAPRTVTAAGLDTHEQDYVTEAPTPAPEPSSAAAFGLSALFASGLVLKARKRRAVA